MRVARVISPMSVRGTRARARRDGPEHRLTMLVTWLLGTSLALLRDRVSRTTSEGGVYTAKKARALPGSNRTSRTSSALSENWLPMVKNKPGTILGPAALARRNVDSWPVMREVAYAGAMNAASAVHLSIFGLTPIVMHGTEEMKRRHLPRVVSGELHATFAVTEPDAGNDITHIKTFAKREGDNYVINGRKVFTTKAQEAHKMLLLTRTTPFEQVKLSTDP